MLTEVEVRTLCKANEREGWSDASTFPRFVRHAIAECRMRRLKKIADGIVVEHRGTGPRTESARLVEARALVKQTRCSFEDANVAICIRLQGGRPALDTLYRLKAAHMARVIERARQLEEERELFGNMTEQGRVNLLRALDEHAGVRPTDAEIENRPFGFQDQRSENGGQVSDPQQLLRAKKQAERTYPNYPEGESVGSEDDDDDVDNSENHCRAVGAHRFCARKSSNSEQGSLHHAAADAHQLAAEKRDKILSSNARMASMRANYYKMPGGLVS
ncbi:MAG: hypothetical protein WBW46_00485 [Candidatus Sulfotelmatobacter sp.]